MALFKIKKGLAANLPANSTEGYCYVTTDDHKFYVDLSTETSASLTSRICLNAAQADTSLDGVEYIEGTQTASTGTWTGITRSPALYVGKTIAYKLPYAGKGNASLILTLADGSQTSAYAVYAGSTRLTTHYPAGTVMVMTWTGTDWRTNAYYNTNTNTLQRTYALASTIELPIVGAATNTAGEYTAFTTSYKDLYGVIPNDTSKVATIQPSTGHITVPGGITANLTGDCTGTAGGVAWDNVSGKPDTYTPASHSHGNLSNAGCITAAITVANGDYLIIGDTSASGKIGKGPAFVSTTAHKFLKDTGAFTAIAAADLPAATTSAKGAVIVGTGLSVSSGTISVSYGDTATTAAAGNHTHTTSISKTGTATVNLAADTVYTLTAGGTSVVFKTPADTTTNYYHTTGSWSGLTYTATANGGAGALALTLPTGTTATTVAVGNHNHDSVYLKLSGGTLTDTLGLRTTVTKGTNPSATAGRYI